MYEDSKGRYWVSVADGVGRLDPKTGKVMEMLSERHPELKTFRLVHALCPLGNDCFVAVGDNGLFYYDADTTGCGFLMRKKINSTRPV